MIKSLDFFSQCLELSDANVYAQKCVPGIISKQKCLQYLYAK